jgi:8-amino-7-oxononanoate synthase
VVTRGDVPDFTSALYLGLNHAYAELRPWTQLTLGKPAALTPPPESEAIADQLARLIGCERATLGTSTLHLFWDVFGHLSRERIAIYVDAGTYPIARWGVERALTRGALVRGFKHHNVRALQQAVLRDRTSGRTPFVVTDGFCPGCGRHAPLNAYLDSVQAYGGRLIIDDTQALGIYGQSARGTHYGRGGGGSLRWHAIDADQVLVISSLAKGFGVPLAVLAGSHASIEHFNQFSETRVHCSPPSVAMMRAAEHALIVNVTHGDLLRDQLAQRVRYFRTRLAELALSAEGGLFPVQTLRLRPAEIAIDVHERLRDNDIETVLHRDRSGSGPRVSFIFTARHRRSEIDRAVMALANTLAIQSAPRQPEAERG